MGTVIPDDYATWEIGGHTVEYFDDIHQYIVDGICLPSITQCLKFGFGNKYASVDASTLKRASERGIEVHKAIEEWCKNSVDSELPELKNFKFLQKQYGFIVLDNEVPVLLFSDDEPICAGRLDLVIDMDGKTGLADIKRTSALDKDYLAYQLNLYRIAYRQSYGIEAEFLRGIHLRDNVRKFVQIPINEKMALDMVDYYLKGRNDA